MRCRICNKPTSANIRLTEPRYFHGEGNVCQSCFEKLAVFDYLELDKRVFEKIRVTE